jgi:putative membrane protein
MKRVVFAFAALACTSLAALAADDTESKQKITDQQFVMKASAGGLAEVNLSRLAATRARSDDVKQFAKHMLEDHNKANKELNALADKLRIPPAQTQEQRHEELATRLSALSGAQFDREFMKAQVKAHEETVDLFKAQAENGQNKDLKALAKKMLPTLEKHLKDAKDVCKKCEEGSKDKEDRKDKKDRDR